jgi:hypothetical protein
VSEEVLEELRLLSNLETDTEKLIQIILVGQPEFEARLERPELDHLKQRIALRCRLRPLAKNDIEPYIESRLRTVNCWRHDLFDEQSIEHIAHYSKGIPRLINVICDNALLIAYANNRGYVIVGDIDEAAHELQLAVPFPIVFHTAPRDLAKAKGEVGYQATRSQQLSEAKNNDHSTRPAANVKSNGARANERPRAASRVEPPRPEFEPFFADTDWNRQAYAHGRNVGLLIFLCMMAGTVLFIGVHQKEISIPAIRAYVERLSDFGRDEEKPQPAPPPVTHTEASRDDTSQAAPAAEAPPIVSQDLDEDITPEPEPTKPAEPVLPLTGKKMAPAKKSFDAQQNKRVFLKDRAPAKAANEAPISDRKLELQIYKAINDRAIRGVQVSSVDEGTVYLEGRVATPRQKLAVVRAVMGVPGVKRVRDRIVIDY